MEYLSKACYDALLAELHQMETVDLPRAQEQLVEAREKGDLSENFEYHAAKRELGRLLGRIRFKHRVLQNSAVLDTSRLDAGKVVLLSRVTLENLNTHAQMTYTLVSHHEANLREGKLSVKSPIGSALLGKSVDDIVEVQVPAGLLRLRIVQITL